MKSVTLTTLLAITLFFSHSLLANSEVKLKNGDAQQLGQSIDDAPPAVETDMISGLILNRAMTRFGHRFYRSFVSSYRDINGMTDHNGITIEEKATALSGSIISIYHNRRRIFITAVSPASRDIDERAKQAAQRIDQVLKQNKKQASWAQFLNPDLAPDEF